MKNKDPYKNLDPAFKNRVEAMSDNEIRAKVSEVALYRQARLESLKNDPEVEQAKDSLSLLTADYKADVKASDLKIRFAKEILERRGKL